ncbi:MAG TPA: hypothetical protein VMR06_11250 [Dokdonella sp.]|uniref:hypothetical protein n=1 Tax=Dokdonella sp. TaxID=2291710 RepID=UPI002CECFD18|nr:hypothetical protein [Dokdonella sp.]HUD42555.1 hypothetical protein [Dokdonella sp.]
MGRLSRLRHVSWLLMGLAACAEAAFPRLEPIDRRMDFMPQPGNGQLLAADLDGDGVSELILDGSPWPAALPTGGPAVLATLRHTAAGYDVAPARVLSAFAPTARLLAHRVDGVDHVVVVDHEGMLREYRGWDFEQVNAFPIAAGAQTAAIGDVDADGHEDVVVLTATGLHMYALSDGRLVNTYAVSDCSDLALAPLDADPALEIVLACMPGLVLDGATHATDWSYIDGFGIQLAAGRFGEAASHQWVGAQRWYSYTVFRGAPWSPLWSGKSTHDIGAVAAGQLPGSAHDMVLIGDAQWGSVHVIDGASGEERFAVQNIEPSVNSIVTADLDADQAAELAFNGGSSMITIASGVDGQTRARIRMSAGPFLGTGYGDVDGDGRIELVAVDASDRSNIATLAMFDLSDGQRTWDSRWFESAAASGVWRMSRSKAVLRAQASGNGMDIVLAGEDRGMGRILVLDGVTKEVGLNLFSFSTPALNNLVIKDIALVHYDGDGVEDFALAVYDTSHQSAALLVLSGTSGAPLWRSPAMGDHTAAIYQVVSIEDPTTPGKGLLVAALSDSVRAYNRATGLLDWVIPIPNTGISHIASGVSGAELAVFSSTGETHFYDLATRVELRRFALPGAPRALHAVGGDLRQSLIATQNQLMLIDGSTGSLLTVPQSLDDFPETGTYLSVVPLGDGAWQVASGTTLALYRHRLELSDVLFDDGFDH